MTRSLPKTTTSTASSHNGLRDRPRSPSSPRASVPAAAPRLVLTKTLPAPLQRFRNLSISSKQLIGLMTSEAISVIGLVGVGAWLIIAGGRAQLLNQAKSELVVTETNYNIKVNQMGFGFRGQSDNVAVIEAAQQHQIGKPLNSRLRQQVRGILQNEVKARVIEYATLVGADLRIVVNANADRQGERFDPQGLVSRVLREPNQIKTSEIVPWSDLQREAPPLPTGMRGKDALIRYTVTPVRQPGTGRVIGALVSGDIVDGKKPIVQNTVEAFGGGYSGIYARQPNGSFVLSTSLDTVAEGNSQTTANVPLPNTVLLETAAAAKGQPVTERVPVGNQTYTMAAKSLPNVAGDPVAILVRGTSEVTLDRMLRESLSFQLVITGIAITADILLAIFLGWMIVTPLRKLRQTTQAFSEGNLTARAEVEATDEVGELATTFNQMASRITLNLEDISRKERLLSEETQEVETARQLAEAARQEAEHLAAEQQRQREQLQRRALELLQEVDPISQGDLTVQARVTPDEIGTLADSYNAIAANLRKLVSRVQVAVERVTVTANNNELTVRELSQEAAQHAAEITAALAQVEQMTDAIQTIATTAEQAEDAMQVAAQTVQLGDTAMNRTVDGIQAIRATVADAAKKVKHLGESSQKISTVVELIGTFAAQTRTLALNASIEAALAGKEGRGFAVVAEEVRALARRSAEAAEEIKALVASIQAETNEVVTAMEAGTEQVVIGTRLVDETRQSLNRITDASTQMEQLVATIAQATLIQTATSETVTRTMKDVAAIATQTSVETSQVSESFEELRQLAQTLQADVGQFKVN